MLCERVALTCPKSYRVIHPGRYVSGELAKASMSPGSDVHVNMARDCPYCGWRTYPKLAIEQFSTNRYVPAVRCDACGRSLRYLSRVDALRR